MDPEQDDTFSFIAGYTAGGTPYGVTWEQMGMPPNVVWKDSAYLKIRTNMTILLIPEIISIILSIL